MDPLQEDVSVEVAISSPTNCLVCCSDHRNNESSAASTASCFGGGSWQLQRCPKADAVCRSEQVSNRVRQQVITRSLDWIPNQHVHGFRCKGNGEESSG